MTHCCSEGSPTTPAPAPASTRARHDPSASFAAIAAVGATFAGFVQHGRNPDLLSTGIAVAVVFFAALAALYVLHVVYRITLAGLKLAIPVAVLLLVGCALDWHWAERAVDWLRAAGAQGVHAAAQGWSAAAQDR